MVANSGPRPSKPAVGPCLQPALPSPAQALSSTVADPRQGCPSFVVTRADGLGSFVGRPSALGLPPRFVAESSEKAAKGYLTGLLKPRSGRRGAVGLDQARLLPALVGSLHIGYVIIGVASGVLTRPCWLPTRRMTSDHFGPGSCRRCRFASLARCTTQAARRRQSRRKSWPD